jgi:hypothetical protein
VQVLHIGGAAAEPEGSQKPRQRRHEPIVLHDYRQERPTLHKCFLAQDVVTHGSGDERLLRNLNR